MDKFFTKISKDQFGCWNFTGFCEKGGYGQYRYQGKLWRANRLSYTLTKGPIPKGMFVCHSCDNPACINPDHLFLGLPKDNTQDMISKNRKWKGKKIKTPNGIFSSRVEAAKFYKRDPAAIGRRMKNHPQEYYYI